MYLYTLGFIIRKNEVLMLNRNFEPWMGCWNGIGGKREENESPLDCIIRETLEETGLIIRKDQITNKGVVTWNTFTASDKGLHLFIIHVDKDFEYKTPLVTKEGILDWKDLNWVNNKNNIGISHNIPYFLPDALSNNSNIYNYVCTFENKILLKVEKIRID